MGGRHNRRNANYQDISGKWLCIGDIDKMHGAEEGRINPLSVADQNAGDDTRHSCL